MRAVAELQGHAQRRGVHTRSVVVDRNPVDTTPLPLPDGFESVHAENFHNGWDFQPFTSLNAVIDQLSYRVSRITVASRQPERCATVLVTPHLTE